MRPFAPLPAVLLLAALMPRAALADEALIRRNLAPRLGGIPIEAIARTAYKGLYEIQFDGKVAYTNEDGSFMLVGSLIDSATGRNLTQDRLRRLTAIDFSALPLDQAIKRVRGKGSRRLALFTDPLCPHCRQQEKELAKIDDLTLYVFIYPFERQHPGATARGRDIWCSPDPGQAWEDFMLKGAAPKPGACPDPVAKNVALGERLRFEATPTFIFSDGAVSQRGLTAAQIEKFMAEAK